MKRRNLLPFTFILLLIFVAGCSKGGPQGGRFEISFNAGDKYNGDTDIVPGKNDGKLDSFLDQSNDPLESEPMSTKLFLISGRKKADKVFKKDLNQRFTFLRISGTNIDGEQTKFTLNAAGYGNEYRFTVGDGGLFHFIFGWDALYVFDSVITTSPNGPIYRTNSEKVPEAFAGSTSFCMAGSNKKSSYEFMLCRRNVFYDLFGTMSYISAGVFFEFK